VAAEYQKLRSELAFEKAVSSVKLTDKQRSVLEKVFQSERPENPAEWVKGYADIFGAVSTPPAQSQAVTNTGAPGSTTASVATPDGQMPPADVWRAMSDEDKLKSYRSFTNKHSSIDTRFARRTPQKG
jgi:hypothetical protein